MIKYLNKYLFFVVLALSGVNLINAQTDALGETLVGLLKSDGAWPPTFKFTTGYSAADYQGDVVVDGTTHSIGSGRMDVTIPEITPSSNLNTLVSTFNVGAYRVDLFNANNTQLGSIALSDIGAGGTTTINIAKVSTKTDYKVKAQLWIKRVGATDYEYVFNDDNLYSITLWPEPSVTTPSIAVQQLTDDKSYEFNQTATTTGGYNQGWSYDWKLNTTSIGNQATCRYTLDVDVAETQLGPSIFTFKVDAVNYAPDGNTVWFKYTADNVAQVKMYDAPKAPTSLTQYKTSASATTVYNIADGMGLTDAQLASLGYTLEFDGTASASHQYVGPAATKVKAVRTYSDGFNASSAEVTVGIISTASSKIIPVLTAGTAAYGEGYGPVNTEGNSYGWVGSSLTFSETPKAAFNRTNNVTITAKKASFGGTTHNVDVPFDNLTKGNNNEVRVQFGATIATADGDSYSFDFDMTQKHGVYIYDTPVKPTTALTKTQSPDNVRLGNTLTATIARNTGNPDGWEYKWMSSFLFNDKELATEAIYADNTIYAIDGTSKRTEPVHYTLVCTNIAPDGTVWYSTAVDAGETMIYNVPAKPGKLAHYQYTYKGEEQNLYVAHNTGANDATDDYEYFFDGKNNGNIPALLSASSISNVYTQFTYSDGYVTQSAATQISASDHYSPSIDLSVNGINLTDESGLDGFTYAGAVIENQNNRAYALAGSEVEFNASATLANTTVSSTDVINKASRMSAGSSLALTSASTENYIPTFVGTITVDGDIRHDIKFDGTQDYAITCYAKPTVPTGSATGRLQITDAEESNVAMSAITPTNGADNWTQQWSANGTKIADATATSYTDKVIRTINSAQKQIDQYDFSVTFENRINPGDATAWLTYTLPVTTLKVYNEPNAVGSFDVYDLKSVNDANQYYVTPANIGLTNEQLKDYGYQIIFDDAIIESEFLGNGRSIYDLDIPSFIRTRFIYDDGFETYSPVNNTPNIITVTTSANPSLSHAALQQAAKGYTIGDPVTVDGTHYGIAGATLKVNPSAKFSNLTSFTCDAKVDGNDIAEYVATEGQKIISTTYRATIQVESNQTEFFSFEGTNDNSVYIHPAPTIPTITSGLYTQILDIHHVEGTITCSTPMGANPSAWSVQWLNNDTEIVGATDTKYSYNYSKDVEGNAKKKETDVYSMRYTNLAPDGLTEWVKGTVENVGSITFYNTPNAVYSLDLVKIGNQTEAYAAGLGLTDDELRNLEYEFVFNDNVDAPQRSRKFEGDNVESVYSRWTYGDGFVSINKGLAAGVRTLTFDWGTYSLVVVSDTETDQRYKGNVKDAENNMWYGLSGKDTAKLTASYTFDNYFDTINAELTAKTIINKDGQEAASLDFTGSVDYTLGEVGTYDLLNHAEIVYYAESNQTYEYKLDQQVDGTITILPYPTINEDIATFSGKQYDDIDTINFTENFSNAGANSEGWAFDCYVDNNSGYNGGQTFAIDSDYPDKKEHKVKIAYSNTAPDGETKWFEGQTEEVPFYVYNTPNHQPTAIGHFTDEEANQDFYFAMGTGLDDTALNKCGYKFIGSYGDYNIIYDNDKRVFSTSSAVPTGVSAVWIYSDDNNEVEYISPADHNRKYCTTINEYAFNYSVTTELSLGENHPKENGYLKTNIEDANKNLHGFVNDAINSTFSVKLNKGDIELTKNSKIVLTKDDKPLPSYDFGNTPSTLNAAGTYSWAMEVETLLPVEDTQTILLTGKYTEPVKFVLWAVPTITTPSVESFTASDYEVPTLNLEAEAAKGATDLWSQQWYRNDVKLDGKTKLDLEKDEVLDDPSLEMHTTDYSYAIEYTNIAPDGQTEWFKKKVNIGVVTVYNAPASPGALVHYVDSTTPANDRWIVANVGLSDEQIDAREYSFEFSDGTNTIDIDGTRYLKDKDTPEFTSVKSVWKYSDGKRVYGQTPAKLNDGICAFPSLTTNIEVTKGDNENDSYYQGSVRNDDTIYALAGSDVKVTISTTDAMTMSDVKLLGIGDITDMTIAEGQKSASVKTSIKEADTYKLGIDMSVQGVIDFYLDEGGNTAYEYANLGATATWSCPAQIKILDKPVYPQAEMQYLQYRDIDASNTTFTVSKAKNGNNSWDYAWIVKVDGKELDPDSKKTGTSYEAKFSTIDSDAKDSKLYTYTLQFGDKSPVDENDYWIDGEIPVGEIRVYNTPKAPEAVMVYDGGNGNTNTYTYSIAYGMGMTNTELYNRDYKFSFGSNINDKRYVKGNASSVKSLWKYNAIGENYPAFDCYSNEVTTVINDKAVISGEVKIGLGNVEVEGYAGATQDKKDDLRWYALEGSAADYEFNVQSDNSNNGLNLKVKTSDFSLNDNKIGGSTSNMKWSTSYNKANVYNGVVNGTLVATVDPSMGSDNTIDLPFQLDIPSNTIVEVMATPTLPKENENYPRQYRDIDILNPQFGTHEGAGANDDWRYHWTFNGTEKYADEKEPGTLNYTPTIEGDAMATETHTFTLNWENVAPNGESWITGTIDYPITIYNTPEAPAALTRKGNGISNIYVATGMAYGGQAMNDKTLTDLGYKFVFGDDADNDSADNDSVHRWYKFQQTPANPWVRALWTYDDGYRCVSDPVYLGADGAYSERGESDMDLIQAMYGDDVTVYTTAGVPVPQASTERLQPGVYIIRYGTGDDARSEKIVIR